MKVNTSTFRNANIVHFIIIPTSVSLWCWGNDFNFSFVNNRNIFFIIPNICETWILSPSLKKKKTTTGFYYAYAITEHVNPLTSSPVLLQLCLRAIPSSQSPLAHTGGQTGGINVHPSSFNEQLMVVCR